MNQPEERKAYFRRYRQTHPHRPGKIVPGDPVDEARHRESVLRWITTSGYDVNGWLPWDVRELKRSAGL
jgi:hypothetical protein